VPISRDFSCVFYVYMVKLHVYYREICKLCFFHHTTPLLVADS
jgi:hypothetical protein